MPIVSQILYYAFGIFSLSIASIVPQDNYLSLKRKFYIVLYLSLITLGFGEKLGQLLTPFALLGVLLILCWKTPDKSASMISFFSGYLSLVCIDYLLSTAGNTIWRLSLTEMQQHYIIPLGFFYLLTIYVVARLLRYILYKRLHIQDRQLPNNLLLCILGNLSISVAICVFGIVWGEKIGYPPNVIRLNAILFLLYFIITSVLFVILYRISKNNEELNTRLIEYKNLETYTQEVESLYMDMRSFKHDYIDILTSLKSHIDTENIEELKTYFYTHIFTLSESMQRTDSRLGTLSNLKINELKSVISAKLLYALEKGVNVTLEILDPIDEIQMDLVDMVRVISIFINNAIESALETSDKEVQLAFIRQEHSIVFLLRNSYVQHPFEIHRLCNYGISTKGEYRGIGLYTAKNIIDQYEHILWEMDCFDLFFKQQLTIHNTSTK